MIPLSEFSLFLGRLMSEILLPTRAEIDMPAPETSHQRLWIPIIMRAELTVLARILFHTFHVKVNTANVIFFSKR